MPPLLCPIALPISFVIGAWGLVILTPLVPLAALYLLLWRGRYGGFLRHATRLRGRIVGPQARGTVVLGYDDRRRPVAAPFQLAAPSGQVVWVAPDDAVLRGWPARVRVGGRVTVDGVPGAVDLPGEFLFRDTPQANGLLAIQVARGAWPRLRGPIRAIGLGWLLSFALLFVSAFLFS